jgi:phosphotriesterase-related protein
VKVGILKCATAEPGVTPDIELILRATARAHRRTGVAIATHTNAARKVGLDQQRIFREEGVDLSRVVIGHSGDTTDVPYLEELIGNGSSIATDG